MLFMKSDKKVGIGVSGALDHRRSAPEKASNHWIIRPKRVPIIGNHLKPLKNGIYYGS